MVRAQISVAGHTDQHVFYGGNLVADWKYTRIYNPQRRPRVLVIKFRIEIRHNLRGEGVLWITWLAGGCRVYNVAQVRRVDSIYHLGNVPTDVRIQIILRTVTNSLQDHQNGRTGGQGSVLCQGNSYIASIFCSIPMDFHPSQVTYPESGEGIRLSQLKTVGRAPRGGDNPTKEAQAH
ncbi:hypothetical protein TNCV_2601771 [Trichonephila clavipes]|nr:hypothetical protein TNCV_2601771 [Trichonephila clavipes]